MAQIISISIDLTKIDKTKIVQGENGGKYYNLDIAVNDEPDKYKNDCSVMEKQTKEQREAKEKRVYLGNGRIVWAGASKPKSATESTGSGSQEDTGLPF